MSDSSRFRVVAGYHGLADPSWNAASAGDFDAQEVCWNRGGAGARVLLAEEILELRLQVRCAAALLGRLERIHRGPIVLPELIDELRRRPGEAEDERIPDERHLVCGDPGGAESLDHVGLAAPCHGAHEPRRRRRR